MALLLGSLTSGSRSEGPGGGSREGRGEPNKDVKWSLCSGRLLRHVGQKSGKLIPPRKALSTIFPFFAGQILRYVLFNPPHFRLPICSDQVSSREQQGSPSVRAERHAGLR